MKLELLSLFSHSVPPSKPYFEVDMKSPWVAGRKYVVACIAPDAKPEAEIILYKGALPLSTALNLTVKVNLTAWDKGQQP